MFSCRIAAYICSSLPSFSLQWRHNGFDGISNHQPHHCLLSRLFGRRSKKTSKLCVTVLCVGNSLGTGEFPPQMASYEENVSIWWRHHVMITLGLCPLLKINLGLIMAYCLAGPSHYQSQHWLPTNEVLQHSCEGDCTGKNHDIKYWNMFGNYEIQIKTISLTWQWIAGNSYCS